MSLKVYLSLLVDLLLTLKFVAVIGRQVYNFEKAADPQFDLNDFKVFK